MSFLLLFPAFSESASGVLGAESLTTNYWVDWIPRWMEPAYPGTTLMGQFYRVATTNPMARAGLEARWNFQDLFGEVGQQTSFWMAPLNTGADLSDHEVELYERE